MAATIHLKFLIFLLALLLVQSALAIKVDIEIKEVIDGNLAWVNITSTGVQKILIVWENLGSVGCETRARVDFYFHNQTTNKTERVYIGWSKAEPIRPGDSANLEVYSHLPEGNFTAKIRIYHCNEIFESKPYSVNVEKINSTPEILSIVDVETFTDHVEVSVKSETNVENAIVVPSKYPLGWIFESGKIDSIAEGETKKIKLGFKPSIWKEERVEFKAITEDGKFLAKRSFILEKQRPYPYERIFTLTVTILLIVLILMYLHRKKVSLFISKKWK
jgi:hypothetical protein